MNEKYEEEEEEEKRIRVMKKMGTARSSTHTISTS